MISRQLHHDKSGINPVITQCLVGRVISGFSTRDGEVADNYGGYILSARHFHINGSIRFYAAIFRHHAGGHSGTEHEFCKCLVRHPQKGPLFAVDNIAVLGFSFDYVHFWSLSMPASARVGGICIGTTREPLVKPAPPELSPTVSFCAIIISP